MAARVLRPKALVVIDSGGWVDVYASDTVETLVVNSPRSIASGPKLEEHDKSVYNWLLALLPPRFAAIFRPLYKVATGYWSRTDLQEIVDRHREDRQAARKARR